MRINDDLSSPVVVHASEHEWAPSPVAGVERRMLFRIGDEIARATSVVRYAPGSVFPRHTHRGGEEILVLEGVFEDEHGDYPAGTYFRNPPGTSHVPSSEKGCTIFVRLCQFRQGDQTQIARLPGEGQQVPPREGGARATVLFDDGHEQVRLEQWHPGGAVRVPNTRGLEFLVVSGTATIADETLEAQAWGRLPAGVDLEADVHAHGATVWMKHAPLLHPDVHSLRD